jgi:hypothetical protein
MAAEGQDTFEHLNEKYGIHARAAAHQRAK